ncbi:hypothetical protein N0V93_009274 [Gnomoniopsis smithogilvyi]|uniref:Uncharacterized protein n=1 Tax=Gnomoniopsis smithogilvyi TaxID=1191159 RepID=A0A9W8YKG1_9PEZI|nr:hypothetical protein N0V93_009274 [Gnomoniopsis smithogilvyi]
MVLLTSSQVSVAISSAIVVSFTTALFLSGYAIQQRTVRHLRAAIRPDSSPQIFLPDRFRDDTTELEDGTIVMLDEYNRPIRLKAGRISIGQANSFNVADGANGLETEAETNRQGQDEVKITVQETLPEVTDQQQTVIALEDSPIVQDPTPENTEVGQESQAPLQGPEQEPMPEPVPEPVPEAVPEPVQAQPQPAPWEIRGDDMVEEEPLGEIGDEDGGKPMSRAERRRKIKEEIQKLSQGDTPLYYQRRLW